MNAILQEQKIMKSFDRVKSDIMQLRRRSIWMYICLSAAIACVAGIAVIM